MKFGVGPCVAWGVQGTYCGGGGGTFLYHPPQASRSRLQASLQHFNAAEDSEWQGLMPGRAAKFFVGVSNGALDLHVYYLHTGTESAIEESKRQLIN